jgi:Family of unknown function (DUF695)
MPKIVERKNNMSKQAILSHIKRDAWISITMEVDDAPCLFLHRDPIPDAGDTPGYEHLLRVVWVYDDEGSGALPDDDLAEQMQDFDDRLCAAWESDGLAILTAVLTFDGARQWVFYTGDPASCGNRLEAMPQEAEPYPIELDTNEDPDWSYLHQTLMDNFTE